MAALNRNAVKLALPALFEAMADPKWQTKQAATVFLGHLATAAPEQISVSARLAGCVGLAGSKNSLGRRPTAPVSDGARRLGWASPPTPSTTATARSTCPRLCLW